jgi:hypothetical protein
MKTNLSKIENFAAECQLAADDISYNFITALSLARVQSICDFNVFWLYSIAPEVVLHIKTVDFLKENIDKFKRKISIKEMLIYDFLINLNNPDNFNEFKELIMKLRI